MVQKAYEWVDGAELEEHSKRKHKVLREYFFQYITVRCKNPQQEKFRLAIMDGFAGGGRYKCGAPGSPIIFIEELEKAVSKINTERAVNGLKTLEVECLLILNDANADAHQVLQEAVAPILAAARDREKRLYLDVQYLNQTFEEAYPVAKSLIEQGRYRTVLFNLDQCGHSHVERSTLEDIMRSFAAPEIFYTFAIQALLAFLEKSEPSRLQSQLQYIGLDASKWHEFEAVMSNDQWLGVAERLVFDTLSRCAQFVSPFSIQNPKGWRYWMIHFSGKARARQVYNNTLHNNSTAQAHFGRAGLEMLSYNPNDEGQIYLFDESGRETAQKQLFDDIPRMIMRSGDAINVNEFYEDIYNATPAHMDDIHAAIIDNPDLEVTTPAGGERRKPNTINAGDTIRIKNQRSFSFPTFPRKL
ncbi:MAG: three-Cys-motif partner protein TcmP [Pseudomonadota bacterium]